MKHLHSFARRAAAFLLAAVLCVGPAAPAAAARAAENEIEIRSAQDLAQLAEQCALDTWSELLEQADKVVTVSPAYDAGCMHRRNRYLVDHSAVCIGWGTGETGGTAYTIHYAEKQGLRIIRFLE